jgi:hypothetical protein
MVCVVKYIELLPVNVLSVGGMYEHKKAFPYRVITLFMNTTNIGESEENAKSSFT